MNKHDVCRIIAGVLVLITGAAIGFGSVQLWNGAPTSWPDVVAGDATVKNVANGMFAMAILLFVVAIAVLGNFGWGPIVAAIAVGIFVAAAFWANYALFGSVRPMHTGINVVFAGLILWLLWIGYSGRHT